MDYTDEDIKKLKHKLEQLKEMYSFQIEIGEDTSVVNDKIKEIEEILNEYEN